MGQKQGEITRQRKLAIIHILIQNQETDSTELIENIPDISSMKNPSAALTEPIKELRKERIIPQKRKRIEHKKGVKGAIPLHIKIINSSKTIRVIFDSYPTFHRALYNSDWVRETMVNDRITFPLPGKSKEELKSIYAYHRVFSVISSLMRTSMRLRLNGHGMFTPTLVGSWIIRF